MITVPRNLILYRYACSAINAVDYPGPATSAGANAPRSKIQRVAQIQKHILGAVQSTDTWTWLYVDWAHPDDLICALQNEELTSHIYKEQVLISEYDALIPIRPAPTDPTNVEFTVDPHGKWLGLLPKDTLEEISNGVRALEFFYKDLQSTVKEIHIQCRGIEGIKHTTNRLLSYVPEFSSAHQKLSHIHRQLSQFDTAQEFLVSCAIDPTVRAFRGNMMLEVIEAEEALVLLQQFHDFYEKASALPYYVETFEFDCYEPDWDDPDLDW